MAKSIPGQSSMFDPPISADSPSAISSPGLADGATPSDSPDGLTSEPSGQGVAHVSRSRVRGKAMAPQIRATFGLRGSSSFGSAALASSLVSRLRARTDSAGSIVFRLIWKQRATPSGRSISARRASARSTSDNVSGSWPTPKAKEDNDYQSKDGRVFLTVQGTAKLAAWPTPNTPSGGRSVSIEKMDATGRTSDGRKHTASLEHAVKFAQWATPAARDYRSESASDAFNQERWAHPRGKPLSAEATLASWPTPMAGSPATADYNEAGDTMSSRKTRLLVSGPPLNGSHAQTENPGQLNPAHSRWLMGYPPEWDVCGVTAMPSSRKSRPSS
jgi:hypothetical protein